MTHKLILLGRHIGYYNGWEDFGDQMFGFLDFVGLSSNQRLAQLPKHACFSVSLENGTYYITNDEGEELITGDIVDLVKDLPIHTELDEGKFP